MIINFTLAFLLLSVIVWALIFVASIRLVKAGNIPGSRWILTALLGTAFMFFIPMEDIELGEANAYLHLLEIGLQGLFMLIASIGFYRLSKYVVETKNKA